ncbi:transketolase [Clostridium beijerinckii]|uniref:transketolase family protein n=1 Tax=Clostridium beijerinckii TaxID=1520 RepID=UPI00156E800B|nr:transketolase C-terminal domain-containing protein [Clostridium beijerinckii]NRT37018.1 transketolase [Clostridium beijerinckii]NRT43548.1 transketolase [Clostridium beijerinckii]NRZ22460.1 transketolase [Clostridium beijerinckii]
MRNIFVSTLYNIAQNDRDVILITGDLGYGVLTKFWETYPRQFINAGIAEQNMTSIAAGMALEGKKVYTYSIGNFPTLRCLEQIRNDVAYHNANVNIVAVGGGFAYGALGMSHHATEDLAIMRALPNLTVFAPGDPLETIEVTKAANEINGPCYIRLGKGGEKNVHVKIGNFKVGKAINVFKGNEICIFSTGSILVEANKAANNLNNKGISTSLYSFPTIKPIDKETIIECAKTHKCIITIEENNITGGFGSSIAEVLSEISGEHAFLRKIGLNDTYSSVVGSQNYLRNYYGICSEKIEEIANEIVK